MPDKRAIVTGGAGFIGSHVVAAMLAEGYAVVVVDDLSTGVATNVPTTADLVEGNIADPATLRGLAGTFQPQTILHLAAQSSVTRSVADPIHDLDVNVRGTLHVCESARSVGAQVVFASTGGALYGNAAPKPTDEVTTAAPLAPYGASKAAGEAYVGTWGRLHGLANVVLRLGNVYGPRQRSDTEAGVVAIFSALLLSGQPVVIYGDGHQTRDYVHVADVAQAFVRATRVTAPGTYNIATSRETTVLALLEHVRSALGVTSWDERFEPLRRGELLRSCLDSRLAALNLGWRPATDFASGIAETARWYRDAHRG
jgi:UDP-glucose 4-epimerase